MKKILCLSLFLFMILFTGCNKKITDEDFLVGLGKKMEEITKYDVDAEMELKKSEGSIVFDINVKHLAPSYYKVTLTNKENNNIQAIIKNDEGTFVISPALNKSFKFQGDWPLNSSQGYLIQSIYKDLLNDPNKKVEITNDYILVEHTINHKTNSNWTKQKVSFNRKTFMPEEVLIYDSNDNQLVKISFKGIDLKPNITVSDFDVEKTNDTIRTVMGEGLNLTKEFKEVTFLPEGVNVLNQMEKVTDTIAMATFSGDYNYTIIQKEVEEAMALGCNYLYQEIVLLDSGIGFIGNNVLTWYEGGMEYNIYSTDLELSVMMDIANSLKTN